jgi:aquaporin Z
MNPARALAPALFSGMLDDLWLYWTAPYLGTVITAVLFRNKFRQQK